jgi:hypothetical protein
MASKIIKRVEGKKIKEIKKFKNMDNAFDISSIYEYFYMEKNY